jgi:hypothetical protein
MAYMRVVRKVLKKRIHPVVLLVALPVVVISVTLGGRHLKQQVFEHYDNISRAAQDKIAPTQKTLITADKSPSETSTNEPPTGDVAEGQLSAADQDDPYPPRHRSAQSSAPTPKNKPQPPPSPSSPPSANERQPESPPQPAAHIVCVMGVCL